MRNGAGTACLARGGKPQLLQVEPRCIRTVNSVLTKTVKEDQKNWNLYIPSTCLANNAYSMFTVVVAPSPASYGLVGSSVCLVICFSQTRAFPHMSIILISLPN